jgi:hypothetical protein
MMLIESLEIYNFADFPIAHRHSSFYKKSCYEDFEVSLKITSKKDFIYLEL